MPPGPPQLQYWGVAASPVPNDGVLMSTLVNRLKLTSSANDLISILPNVIGFSINRIIE